MRDCVGVDDAEPGVARVGLKQHRGHWPVQLRSNQRQDSERALELLENGRPYPSMTHAELARKSIRGGEDRQRQPVQQEQMREGPDDSFYFTGLSVSAAAQLLNT